MAGCFSKGSSDCHYPVESDKEKDCKNNPDGICYREGGGCNETPRYPGRDRVEDRQAVDREGIDLYFSVRLKPINIFICVLTIGVVVIATLLIKQWVEHGYNV